LASRLNSCARKSSRRPAGSLAPSRVRAAATWARSRSSSVTESLTARWAALGAIAREMRGQDQRKVRLLDLGCGNGRFLRQVMEAYPRLNATGLDLSPAYTDMARRRLQSWPQVDVLHEAAEAIPLETGGLDIVVSVFLFHELPRRIRQAVLSEVSRVLKPGGLFILADSVQFGDYPELDGLLEYFPHGFHEPYYKGYLSWDAASSCRTANLVPEDQTLAFLTKISTFRKRL